jgi:hypothetical protein
MIKYFYYNVHPYFTLPDTISAGYAQFIGQLSKWELKVIEAILAG